MANQIYTIVNSIVAQALGNTALTVVDEGDLIALGDTVLSSSTNVENFLNTLVQRIGKTIVSYRRYKSAFSGLVLSDMEYGNIVQKLKVSMPSAEADESYGLADGYSVDHYKVAKPGVQQKLFTSETPYQLHITIQRVHLKEAFLSAAGMESFISAIFGEVQNKIELSLETLGRNCLNNYIAECVNQAYYDIAQNSAVPDAYDKVDRVVFLTFADMTGGALGFDEMYKRYITAGNLVDGLGYANAEEELRDGMRKIKTVSKQFKFMSDYWNDGTATRHTPVDMQRMYILSGVATAFETNVEYAAFHNELLSLGDYQEVPYWQSLQQPFGIDVMIASNNLYEVKTTEPIEVSGDGDSWYMGILPVAVLFDRDALGVYKRDMWTATTPFNAAGGYSNTYWHMRDIWFNDMSENFIVFAIGGSETFGNGGK